VLGRYLHLLRDSRTATCEPVPPKPAKPQLPPVGLGVVVNMRCVRPPPLRASTRAARLCLRYES
jgi:hypothetical protein